VLEALGAVLVVLGLGFLSLPVALIAAGLFLVVVANAPAADRSGPGFPPDRAGPQARVPL
jgi:hypothetical protein